MTLQNLVFSLGQVAVHFNPVNGFYGISNIGQLDTTQLSYPAMGLVPSGDMIQRKGYSEYSLTFYVLDRLLTDSANDFDIYSYSLETLKNYFKQLRLLPKVISITEEPTMRVFTTERGNDRVCGAYSTISIMIEDDFDCADWLDPLGGHTPDLDDDDFEPAPAPPTPDTGGTPDSGSTPDSGVTPDTGTTTEYTINSVLASSITPGELYIISDPRSTPEAGKKWILDNYNWLELLETRPLLAPLSATSEGDSMTITLNTLEMQWLAVLSADTANGGCTLKTRTRNAEGYDINTGISYLESYYWEDLHRNIIRWSDSSSTFTLNEQGDLICGNFTVYAIQQYLDGQPMERLVLVLDDEGEAEDGNKVKLYQITSIEEV